MVGGPISPADNHGRGDTAHYFSPLPSSPKKDGVVWAAIDDGLVTPRDNAKTWQTSRHASRTARVEHRLLHRGLPFDADTAYGVVVCPQAR